MVRTAASSAFCLRAGSSTIHSKKPIVLSIEIPASRNRLPRSSSDFPEAAYFSSSSTHGSIPRYPAFSAIAISSTIDSLWPRRVLVLRPDEERRIRGRRLAAPRLADRPGRDHPAGDHGRPGREQIPAIVSLSEHDEPSSRARGIALPIPFGIRNPEFAMRRPQ